MHLQAARPITTGTLRVPGADLYFETRGSGPVLALIGCPMDASAFGPLADELGSDYTVVTTDPRGIRHSRVAAPACDVTPETLADDVSRLLDHLGNGPAVVFGSSGGAVAALALAQNHPAHVRVLVAHEPPLEELLDDRDDLRACTNDVVATYLSGDTVGAWGKFLAAANITLTAEDMEQWQREPDPQAIADERFFFEHTLRPTTWWEPSLTILASGPVRIVVGIGSQSTGQTCDRTSNALAAALGVEPVTFPGGHIGFVEQPGPFATRLRDTLSEIDRGGWTAAARNEPS
jgi:pimeloyl-ACP methyl ester carboxylesterase